MDFLVFLFYVEYKFMCTFFTIGALLAAPLSSLSHRHDGKKFSH
ncbi:hypothetical protein O59_000304 [Cellvibrio sp. BR]|nr:hypothetical protein O59_000304 [Cellvibrio sp. BR]